MPDITDMVRRLVEAGCDQIVACAVMAEALSAGVDAQAERRRAADRARAQARRDHETANSAAVITISPQTSAESADVILPSPFPPKKVFPCNPFQKITPQSPTNQAGPRAYRLPSDALPSPEQIADALRIGMIRTEIDSEWPQMRDWSADAKNGACRDWRARWRRWCRTFVQDRGRARGPPKVVRMTAFQQGRQNTRDILNDLGNFAEGSSSGSERHLGLLPGDSGERSSEVRSGLGEDTDELSAGRR